MIYGLDCLLIYLIFCQRLFVAQTDSTETSSCLITPPQVNFLLNGRGVVGRINISSMDTGPQIPTNVTAMLKFGTNLLQVIGHFSGNYVIAIAFMGIVSVGTSDLKDYVAPVDTSQSLDTDVIVGASRVSLKCPISCKRIITPVKGHACKHVQVSSNLSPWRLHYS
uniref:SP-RING-type domain-containing protein n=1 Tax=Kalanchoe fedtschenkoi TaxID=63787 RepID=A0A7N0TM84_KALFE